VFLPFAGCPERCVFCNQPAQTGQAQQPLEALLANARQLLAARAPQSATAEGPRAELAFYGGTFTALPQHWRREFLALATQAKAEGIICRARCSTRPDAISPEILEELRQGGLDLVELGVQSFADAALSASQRGYSGATAQKACLLVRQSGLGLGIQLMPGMPGHTPTDFARDAVLAASFQPELARLYPCLVLSGTPLAELWRGGEYTTWSLDHTVEALAHALLTLWAAGVPAARIGLAEEDNLPVLAGPRHPALGQMARAQALLLHIQALLPSLSKAPNTLLLPRRLQGEALGQGNVLALSYAALGLAIRMWDENVLGLALA